jgi:hypothetical protein
MTQETVQADLGNSSADRFRLGGALWVMAGVACAGLLIFVFVGENLVLQNPGLSALILGGAIAALPTGGLLIARPGPSVVRWSSVVGVVWLIAFGSLTVTALSGPNLDALLSAALITGFGVAGALVAYWFGGSRRQVE